MTIPRYVGVIAGSDAVIDGFYELLESCELRGVELVDCNSLDFAVFVGVDIDEAAASDGVAGVAGGIFDKKFVVVKLALVFVVLGVGFLGLFAGLEIGDDDGFGLGVFFEAVDATGDWDAIEDNIVAGEALFEFDIVVHCAVELAAVFYELRDDDGGVFGVFAAVGGR